MSHPLPIRAAPDRRALILTSLSASIGASVGLAPASAFAASAADIAARAARARDNLFASNSKARELGERARAILVFPDIKKAGFMIGGMGGEGAMFQNGQVTGYYSIGAASFGLQAGVQKFGYALFFMTQSALDYLARNKGWAIGSGPSVVVVDEGFAKTLNTTTLTQDVYAMAFGQKGLMAGIGIEGSKISRINPS
jgi:lipid-binding SYLF domain-containing protein